MLSQQEEPNAAAVPIVQPTKAKAIEGSFKQETAWSKRNDQCSVQRSDTGRKVEEARRSDSGSLVA